VPFTSEFALALSAVGETLGEALEDALALGLGDGQGVTLEDALALGLGELMTSTSTLSGERKLAWPD
jgi:hypothetical protein